MRLRWGLAALALAATAVVSCSSSDTSSSGTPSSEPGATTSSTTQAAAASFDQTVLDELAAEAEAADSDCFLVARDGEVAYEKYWRGSTAETPHEVFSVTKSITSTLVGIARDQGLLDLGDLATASIPEWQGTPSDVVTVEDLLSNDSGRHWDFRTDYTGLIRAKDRTTFAIALGQDAPPGEVWAYNNSAIQTLSRVIQHATGETPADFAAANLFEPLGMDDTAMISDGGDGSTVFIGAQTTCQDLARFGWMMLQGGKVDGEQVVSEDWVRQATTPSQELNVSYGYLWWLNTEGRIASSAVAVSTKGDRNPTIGQQVPGAPEDMFWALGFGNQVLQVDPGTGTVVVRIGASNVPRGVDAFDKDDTARVVTEAAR